MSRTTLLITSLSILTALLSPGCGGGQTPTQPPSATDLTGQIESGESGHECLGHSLLAIDTDSGRIDVIPLRTADLHLNMVSVLNTTLGVHAVGVPGDSDPANGIFAFDITLVHPFGTKPQLAGFDVKGILITPGTLAISSLKLADADETRLLNADGYTRWWNPSEFTMAGFMGYIKGKLALSPASALTAQVNPYKHFADILGSQSPLSDLESVGLDEDMGRGVFTAGQSNTRRFRIKFPMNPGPKIVYGYAVDACWAAPSPNPPTHIPDDFPINANQPEAFEIDLTAPVNTLYYDSESGHGGGGIFLRADVRDWQGIKAGNIYDQIGIVRAYMPGLSPSPYDLPMTPVPPPGKAQYEANLYKEFTPTQAGEYVVALRVESKGGPAYVQGSAPAPAGNISAWQIITVPVTDPDCATDTNNSPAEAQLISGTSDEKFDGSLCGGTDSADYFRIDIPTGKQFGGVIDFYCDIPNTTVGVAKSDGTEIYSSPIDGYFRFTGNGLYMASGTYYFKIATSSSGIAGLYSIMSYYHPNDFQLNYQGEVTPPSLSLDATWLKVYGDHLYLANSDFLWIYDETDLQNPVLLSRFAFTGPMTSIVFTYPYLYYTSDIGNSSNLYYIDVTDPSDISDKSVNNFYPAIDMMCLGSWYLYLAWHDDSSNEKVMSFDYVSNPGDPTQSYTFDVQDGNLTQMDIMFEGGYHPTLLMSYSDAGIYAYNVYDLSSVYLLDSIPNTLSWTSKVDVLYPGYISRINYNMVAAKYQLSLYDFTNGANFIFKDTYDYGMTPASMEAYGNYVVVCNDTNVIEACDISDPTNITMVWTQSVRSTVTYMDCDSDYLYMIQQYFEPRYAIITGGQLPSFGYENYYSVNYPRRAFVAGNAMYMECGKGDKATNVAVMDIANPPAAKNTWKWDQAGAIGSFCGNEKIACWARAGNRLYWGHPTGYGIDSTDSENMPQDISGIAVSDDYLYVALKAPPLMKVYFIADFPFSDPIGLADVSIGYELSNMIVKGSTMYGFTGNQIVTYDLTNPDTPVEHGTYGPISGTFTDRLILGNWMFTLTADSVMVFDISDPFNPDFVTALGMPYADMSALTIMGQYLIASSPNHHPVFIDVSDPASPSIYGEPITTDKFFTIEGVIANDGYLYELADSIGVRIFKFF